MVRFLAVLVAWNFAVAQPLLDLLGRNGAYFVAHSSQPLDVVLLALGLTLGAPALLGGALALLSRLSRGAGLVAHSVVLGVLLALVAVQVLDRLGITSAAVWGPIGLVVAVGGVTAASRWAPARALVRWLSPAPAVFLAAFLFLSPASSVVFRSGGAGAAAASQVGQPVPVVMVVLDELPVVSLMDPDGGIDATSFPNFARLASMSTWYRNTTTVSGLTTWAVPAILDGQPLDRSRLPLVADHPRNLFTLLEGTYRVEAYEAATSLCPARVCGAASAGVPFVTRMRSLVDDTRIVAGHVLLPEQLSRDLPPIDQGWGNFGDAPPRRPGGDPAGRQARAAEVASSKGAAARKQLASTDPPGAFAAFDAGIVADARRLGPDAPVLHYLHVLAPHRPWRFLPDGRTYPLTYGDWKGYRQDFADQMRAHHEAQLRYTDRLLGRTLDTLAGSGLLDRALVVVTADHGVTFQAGTDWRDVRPSTLGDIAWVPLFIKRPGDDAARIDDRPATTLDVLPTVADVLDVKAPPGPGSSLLGPRPARRARTIEERYRLPSEGGLRDAALRARIRVLGDDPSDPRRLFRVGTYGRLVGTAVPPGIPVSATAGRVREAGSFQDVDPTASPLPVMVTAELGAGGDRLGGGRRLLVAVNGVFAGTAGEYTVADGSTRYAALVDPSTLRRGRNAVELYAARREPSSPRLERIRPG